MTQDEGSLRSQASGEVVDGAVVSQLLRGMARRASGYRRSWRGNNASLSTARREYKDLLRMMANAAGITRMTVKPQQITELILRRRADVLKLREERDSLRADMTIRHDALNGVLGRPYDTSPSDYYEAVEAVAELKREVSRLRAQSVVSESVPATPEPCVCNGGWTIDENYQPEDYERNDPLRPEKGLIPCGFCNHGGWDAPWPPAADPSRDSATSEASMLTNESFISQQVGSASTPLAAGEADTTPRVRDECGALEGMTGIECDRHPGHQDWHSGKHTPRTDGTESVGYPVHIQWPRMPYDHCAPASNTFREGDREPDQDVRQVRGKHTGRTYTRRLEGFGGPWDYETGEGTAWTGWGALLQMEWSVEVHAEQEAEK